MYISSILKITYILLCVFIIKINYSLEGLTSLTLMRFDRIFSLFWQLLHNKYHSRSNIPNFESSTILNMVCGLLLIINRSWIVIGFAVAAVRLISLILMRFDTIFPLFWQLLHNRHNSHSNIVNFWIHSNFEYISWIFGNIYTE